MGCIFDDLIGAVVGASSRRSARRTVTAPWVKLAPETPAKVRGKVGPHACGVVTKVSAKRARIAWKDGGAGWFPLRYLLRATARDVASNPHGTPAEAGSGSGALALNKRKLWQTIERERKKEARAKVRALREAHRTARETRREAIAGAKTKCKTARQEAREKREAAKRAAAEARAAARSTCELGAAIATTARGEVKRTRAELQAERDYQRSLRVLERGARARKAEAKRATRAERVQESDDEVRANIDPELRPVFERVKRSIKGSARKSRTEAFLEYIEAHPREQYEAIEDATERAIQEMERRQWEQ